MAAIAAIRSAIATLPPDDQTRITYAIDALEPVLDDELDKVANSYLGKLPVFGGIADDIVKSAIGKALDEGLAQLTAAKSKIGA
jgi:hypothetical protein